MKPKSYVSSLQLTFTPGNKGVCAVGKKKDGLDASKRTLMGSKTSGKDQQNTEKGSLDRTGLIVLY